MFTKEIDNIAQALPKFFDVMRDLQNPLRDVQKPKDLPLETIAKSIWAVLPFHFGAFFGLSSVNGYEATTVVLIGLVVMVLLMWIGAGLGYIRTPQNKARDANGVLIEPSTLRDWRSSQWVAGLVITWFYAVLSITAVNILVLARRLVDGKTLLWPNLFSTLDGASDGAFSPLGFALLVAGVSATIGAWVTSRTLRAKPENGHGFYNVVFIGICWAVTAVLIAICALIL